MLRKFLIFLVLITLAIIPTFAYSESGGFEAGECDYERNGMRCGGSVNGCPSNQRCVATSTTGTPYIKLDGSAVYIGRCDGSNPCTNDNPYIGGVFPDGCGTQETTGFGECAFGTRLTQLFATKVVSSGSNSYSKVTECFSGASSACYAFSVGSLGATTTYFKCTPDSSCTVEDVGCDFTVGNAYSGCPSGQTCHRTNIYDGSGNITGEIGVCMDQGSGSECTGLPGNSAICSTYTGCSVGEYCGSISTWLSTDYCYPVSPATQSPGTCFSDAGDSCGTSLPRQDSSWPSLFQTRSAYCTSGLSCLNPSTYSFTSTFTSYPATGVCAKCVSSGQACTGEVQPGTNGLDDCCNPDMQCVNSTCVAKPKDSDFQKCSSNNSFLAPGAMCKKAGFNEPNLCNSCPTTQNGDVSRIDINGNEYCYGIANSDEGRLCDVEAGACGCSNGLTCSGNGTCIQSSSCVANNAICSPISGSECCGDPTFTCREDPISNNTFRCLSDESIQCTAISNGGESCTNDLEHCCPNDKPYCSAGTCVADFECNEENEGSCCPGFGNVCQGGECVPSTNGECEVDDNVLPPPPAYLGPKIELQDLFSSIGAILYPVGIGIGLFFIVRAGYVIMTSEGNPDGVKKGQEYLTSAIIGTIFILLSTTILRIIINTLLG